MHTRVETGPPRSSVALMRGSTVGPNGAHERRNWAQSSEGRSHAHWGIPDVTGHNLAADPS